MIYDLIVIGAGASGLLIGSLVDKENVLIIEKNSKPGRKLKITGKGRCNITNSKPINEFFDEIFANPKFMYSSLYEFTNTDLMDYLEKLQLKLKEERGGRVFPFNDKSGEVIDTLFKNGNAKYKFNEPVLAIDKVDDIFVVKTEKETYSSKNIIIATGGISYPLTGSTGDGFRFAEEFGHSIVKPKPALVGLNCDLNDNKELMGLNLKNVNVSLISKKSTKSEFGELLFTHFGVSGPTILTLSAYANVGDTISIDLKPALSIEKLDERVLRDFSENNNKDLKNSLDKLLPKSLIPYIINRSKIDPNKKINQINQQERYSLIYNIKNLDFKILSKRSFDEAVITDGGVNVKEINPKTMQSNIVKGLYFAGEVIDVAANTGGYNLQIAFSTAHKAFNSIKDSL